MQREFDVVIVGGGIAGLSMACAIAHAFSEKTLRLPSIALIDAGPAPQNGDVLATAKEDVHDYDPRVSAITEANIRLLKLWGVWPAIEHKRVAAFEKMVVWDGEGTASIEFDADDSGAERLGTVVENRLLVAALYERLQSLAVAQFFHGQALQAIQSPLQSDGDVSGAAIVLDTGEALKLAGQMVIAADGARSKVRELSTFTLRQWDYEQDAIVCTVRTELPHDATAWQCFTRYGPLALLPLGEDAASRGAAKAQHYCSVVWSQRRDISQQAMQASDEDFARDMALAFECKLGAIEALSKRYSFPLQQQHATSYVDGRVVLIGDAAHTLHPLAGQGINMGMQDATRLADAMAESVSHYGTLTHSASLGRYERERLTENLAMMASVEAFKRMFSPGFSAVQLLRNRGMAAVNSSRRLKARIARHAMGV